MEHSVGYNSHYPDTIHFHPTDKDNLIYNIGGLLVIENVHDKHKQEFLRGHDMELSCIAVSNSGNFIASGQKGTVFQRTAEAPVILWSYQTKKPLIVLRGVQDCVNKLAFSPDDRFLACVGQNNTFMIWSTQDGKPIYSRVTDTPLQILTWGEMQGGKHPTYNLITGNSL
jgi:cilia- and flagella-associated protein 52